MMMVTVIAIMKVVMMIVMVSVIVEMMKICRKVVDKGSNSHCDDNKYSTGKTPLMTL